MGQKIGLLGKEGGSGGWSHLHFDITGRQPSGKWGIIEGYAFLWEAYLREYKPKLLAVARPHHLVAAGEKVDARRQPLLVRDGKIATLRVDLHRRHDRDGRDASSAPTRSRASTARC